MFQSKILIGTFLIFVSGLSSALAVELGIDVLRKSDFEILKGKRIGLITNQTGVDSNGTKTRVLLKKNVNLVALYTPEHGLDGTEGAGKYVTSRKDSLTGLTAYSLYGPTRKPTPAMLKGVDVLVYDLQDIGCRSYTYISTMIKCMEAAGENGKEFVVLDRPNPLGGERVEGPPMEKEWISFIGQVPTPYVHGMTAGEIARMANALGWVSSKCNLHVVKMRGWNRKMIWKDTGLRWVKPSPNIPSADSPAYYVATGLIGELAGLEVGAGGPSPFEIMGSRGVDAGRFTAEMRRRGFDGIKFSEYNGGCFGGVRLQLVPETPANLTALNIHFLSAIYGATPNIFARSRGDHLNLFYKSYGSTSISKLISAGVSPEKIVNGWSGSVAKFRVLRKPFLLY